MLRGLMAGLAILHLGPGFAFLVVAFACEDSFSYFQAACQQDAFSAFVRLTLMAWAALITGLMVKIIVTKYINKVN